MKIQEVFGLDVHPDAETREFTCGIEFEIEDIKEQNVGTAFCVETDPSLRNNGLEFKTTPINYERALFLFKHLHSNIKLGPNPFTDRTSIHVHVNCSQLTPEEARQFVLVYVLFEPLFFRFVGPVREGSIYCVPLSYTTLPSIYKKDIAAMHGAWHKYTAFNICPLGPGKDGTEAIGTIEFRHLYGTGDFTIFATWLTAIKELYTFIEQNEGFSIVERTASSPSSLLRKIIPTFAQLYDAELVDSLCENSMLDIKLSTGGLTK